MRGNSPAPFPLDGHVAASIMPAGAPSWITAELVEETVRVWQPYYEQPLTHDDAVAMMLNVGELFDAIGERDVP